MKRRTEEFMTENIRITTIGTTMKIKPIPNIWTTSIGITATFLGRTAKSRTITGSGATSIPTTMGKGRISAEGPKPGDS